MEHVTWPLEPRTLLVLVSSGGGWTLRVSVCARSAGCTAQRVATEGYSTKANKKTSLFVLSVLNFTITVPITTASGSAD